MVAPWWATSKLKFDCTACGDCCRVSGDVWFDKAEASLVRKERWSDALIYDTGHRRVQRTKGACIFLEDNKCSIHNERPQQCRSYPFWPRILRDRGSWEAEQCEGIGLGDDPVDPTDAYERWAAWLRRFPAASAAALDETERWAELVAELNLCPWAKPALENRTCFYLVSDATSSNDVRRVLDHACTELDNMESPSSIVFTIFPSYCRDDFTTFYSDVENFDDAILDASDKQIAGFHPLWTFGGLPGNDPVHFEKRAPHPTISLVHAAAIAHAQAATAKIAAHNEAVLSELGSAALQDRFSKL